MKILDQHGTPIDTGLLREPQTARIAALQHELVQSQLDGLTPAKAARILRDADQGDIVAQHRLFDDMYDRDAHLRCEYDKRRGALLTLDWSIEPAEGAGAREKKLAARIEALLRDAVDDLEDLTDQMMEAPGHGFAAVEIEWQRIEGEWIPKFHPRPQTWFRTDITRRELRLNDGTADGAVPTPMGWVMHQHRKVKTGYLGRAGLFRAVLWPFLYKAYAIGDFAEFLETYGLPIIVGKYMAGATPEEKASLMRAVSALGHDARAIMPDGMALEIQTVTGGAGGSHHLAMVGWADGAQSKAILGQVLSAEAKATGLGSGVADLHAEVRHDILVADARQVSGTLTRDLVYPLIVLNGGGIDSYRRCPRWVFDLGEAEDMAAYADALPKLAQGGARIPVSWVHTKLRIPEAEEGQAVFGAAPAEPPAPGGAVPPTDAAALAARWRQIAALAAPAVVPPSPARYADRAAATLSAAAADSLSLWLEQIRAEVAAAESLEDLRDRLLETYGNLQPAALTAVMETAFAAATLAGRFDVREESEE